MAPRSATVRASIFVLALAAACGDGSGAEPDASGDPGPEADADQSGGGDAGEDPDPDAGNGTPDADVTPDAGSDDDGDGFDDSDCPIYHVECDGECIPAVTDPDNCGGCGITCGDDEVCSGGQCVLQTEFECPSFEDADVQVCDRQCVDTNWDDNNCGGCGITCGDDQGCVFGSCVAAVGSDDDIEGCESGGPPILFPPEDGGDGDGECAGGVAERTFRFGLCSCESIDLGHRIFVDAFKSNEGPYEPGGPGGGIGANQSITSHTADPSLDVTGVLWATAGPLDLNHNSTVGGNLHTGGDLLATQNLEVAQDGYIVADIDASHSVSFGETLHVSPDSQVDDSKVTYADIVREDHAVSEVCTECDAADQLPIGDLVAAAANDNDNDLIGLKAAGLKDVTEPVRLDLPCGQYYLDEITAGSSAEITIVAHGRTALYIGGDIATDSRISIAPAQGAELDVLVAGDVTLPQSFSQFGSPSAPALYRMYVGGDTGVTAGHRVGVGGYLYAVPGGYNQPSQRVAVFGGVYTQDYTTGNQETDIHFDRRVLTVGEQCPPDDGGGGDDDQCVPLGDSCEGTADCCTPLECRGGTCEDPVIIID